MRIWYNEYGDIMKKIGKSDPIIKQVKDVLKTNQYKNLVATDDLEILNLAIKYHLEISHLLITSDIEYKEQTKELLSQLIHHAQECFEISLATYKTIQTKDNHAGIVAIIKIPTYTLDDLKDFVIVLDHLEIPGNIGTIYRTLDACGATGVLLVDPITKPNHPKLLASARGTNLILPTVSLPYEQALDYLQKNGYTIYLGEPNLGLDYQKYSYEGKIAIVVGNERFGIQEDWYHHPHKKVYIPMVGNNNSLNVGVAASILVYEAAMKRKF